MPQKRRGRWAVKAVQPASMPTKCGANNTVGVLPCNAATSPTNCKRWRTVVTSAPHSQPRSNHACAKYTKWRCTARRRCASDNSGKHAAQLTIATRRRGATTAYSTHPRHQPNARTTDKGKRAINPISACNPQRCHLSCHTAIMHPEAVCNGRKPTNTAGAADAPTIPSHG